MYLLENFAKNWNLVLNNLVIINANFHDQEDYLLMSAFQVNSLPPMSASVSISNTPAPSKNADVLYGQPLNKLKMVLDQDFQMRYYASLQLKAYKTASCQSLYLKKTDLLQCLPGSGSTFMVPYYVIS